MTAIDEDQHSAVPYAGLVTRAVALIFDFAVISIGLAVLAGIVGLLLSGFNASFDNNVGAFLAGATCWLLVVVTYFLVFWTSVGETPGMRLMGVTVVSVRGGKIGIRQGVRRLAGMAICTATLGLGYLPVLFNKRRQGLHDRLAGTVVLYEVDAAGLLSLPPAKHLATTVAVDTEVVPARNVIDLPPTDVPKIAP